MLFRMVERVKAEGSGEWKSGGTLGGARVHPLSGGSLGVRLPRPFGPIRRRLAVRESDERGRTVVPPHLRTSDPPNLRFDVIIDTRYYS